MNALEKVVDVITVTLLMFLLPILYYGSRQQVAETVMAGQIGKSFLKRISTAGEITVPVWDELERELKHYGCTEIVLERERKLYEPAEDGTVWERTYCMTKEKIEERLAEQGRCLLQKGDRMRLVLYQGTVPMVYCESVRTGATGG